MELDSPHGPIHEEEHFWYDTKKQALLFEVKVVGEPDHAIPDHSRARERRHLTDRFHGPHYQAHGISFRDCSMTDDIKAANAANAELAVRLWLQVERNEQPIPDDPFDDPLLLPVPKSLAMFMAARRTEMHQQESMTQAFILLQAHLIARTTEGVSI